MPQDRFNLNVRAALLAAIASAYPVIGHSAPAARVDFAVGNVTALGSNGQSRTLGKGAQIEQGDTVNTNGGRAQLRFTDGAYVSLQPQSEFRIDQYRFEGNQDGNETGFFSLLKGGLRTITGLVGRSNKKNYQISTAVATIGIRGTEYTIQYGKSITGTVGEGEIEVCNGGGCLSVTNGESYYVQTEETKPVLTNKRSDLPPPEPTQPPSNFAQGNTTDVFGNPLPGFALLGTQNLDFVWMPTTCDCSSSGSGAVVFDSNGNLIGFPLVSVSNVKMSGNDGIMAWGTFESLSFGSSSEISHFVVGLPVPSSDLSALGGTTGNYTLFGATTVTNSSNQAIGTLDSATLTVNFVSSGLVSAGMNWTINGSPVSASLTGTYFGSSTFSLFGSANCGTSCSVNSNVALFGPNAVRAGMAYSMFDFASNFNASGAAAFAKK